MSQITMSDKIENESSLCNKERREILYEGYFYDVSDFIKRHPGGSIIEYYTQKGEDATLAIQQFHFRSMERVTKLMSYFKKRKADPSEIEEDEKKFERNSNLTRDFTLLYLELQKQGFFEASYLHNLYRVSEVICIYLIGYFLLFPSSIFLKLIGSLVIGLAQGRSGWIQHESGHNSLTGIPIIDRKIHALVFGIGLGLSSTWWARGHNRHHAMPQRLKHDVDLDTLPFMAYNAKVVKNSNQGKSFWIQYQVYLFLLIDTLLGTLVWQLYSHPKYVLKYGYYFQLLSMSAHYFLAYHIGFWPWLLSTWFMSVYLFGNFSLSHTHLPITTNPTHWVDYSLVHTADIKGSFLTDWWMGYLNYQIEHHLFPTMPQFRHPKVSAKVKTLAKKYGIPYYEYGYWEAVGKTFSNLKKVSEELREGS